MLQCSWAQILLTFKVCLLHHCWLCLFPDTAAVQCCNLATLHDCDTATVRHGNDVTLQQCAAKLVFHGNTAAIQLCVSATPVADKLL